jgi:hypothetical protein
MESSSERAVPYVDRLASWSRTSAGRLLTLHQRELLMLITQTERFSVTRVFNPCRIPRRRESRAGSRRKHGLKTRVTLSPWKTAENLRLSI